jgi:hypothetical protein
MDFLHTHTKKQFYTALLQGLCRIGNRSVVCVASYEARELGVRSGSCQKASLASAPPIRIGASPLAGICVRVNLAWAHRFLLAVYGQFFQERLLSYAIQANGALYSNLAKPLFARFYAKLLIPRLGT